MLTSTWELTLGRLLLAMLFAAGAAQKVVDPDAAQALLTGAGLPAWLVWPAALFNAGIATLLLAGRHVRIAALLAAGYCMLTSLFHLVPGDPWQISILVKNWVIAGGFLVLAHIGRTGPST